MLPKKYETVVFQFLISGVMSFLVSGTATLRLTGFDGFTITAWISAWLPAWAVAYPTIVILTPAIRKVAEILVKT
ncbi:MAG: DUF2798 domain-containing protein [Rhizobiaceae bacterium]